MAFLSGPVCGLFFKVRRLFRRKTRRLVEIGPRQESSLDEFPDLRLAGRTGLPSCSTVRQVRRLAALPSRCTGPAACILECPPLPQNTPELVDLPGFAYGGTFCRPAQAIARTKA